MKTKKKKTILTAAGVLAGNLIVGFAVTAFAVPHGIIMGGATGIGLTISHYIPINLSVLVLAVNAILFLMGAFVLGRTFIVTTVASTFLYPLCLSAFQMIPGVTGLTDNIMLGTLFGGVLLGIGVGIIIRVGASTGGTDILALIFHKWLHISVAALLYVVDFAVLAGQAFFSDAEQIMYGILMLVLETFAMNRVMLMGQSQIQLFIISDRYEDIRREMLEEMDAGVTMLHIETGYGKKNQKGVLCVIPKRKLYAANELVQSLDDKAFITISQINEVRGRGFTVDRAAYAEDGKIAEA